MVPSVVVAARCEPGPDIAWAAKVIGWPMNAQPIARGITGFIHPGPQPLSDNPAGREHARTRPLAPRPLRERISLR